MSNITQLRSGRAGIQMQRRLISVSNLLDTTPCGFFPPSVIMKPDHDNEWQSAKQTFVLVLLSHETTISNSPQVGFVILLLDFHMLS